MSKLLNVLTVMMMLTSGMVLGQAKAPEKNKWADDLYARDTVLGRNVVDDVNNANSLDPWEAGLLAEEGRVDGTSIYYEAVGNDMVETIGSTKDVFDDDHPNSYVFVTFYKEDNLMGDSFTWWSSNSSVGNWVWGNFNSSFSDQIDSYVLKGGCYLKLYDDPNKGGAVVASVDLRGDRSKTIAESSGTAASSFEVLCDNNTDASAILYMHGSYTGNQLPLWDSWGLTTSNYGDWDTKVSAIDVNTETNKGVEFESLATPTDGERFWAFADVSILPGELNDHVAQFVTLDPGPKPKSCIYPRGCYPTSTICGGHNQFYARSARTCRNYNGRSYCNAFGNCMNPNTGDFIPED